MTLLGFIMRMSYSVSRTIEPNKTPSGGSSGACPGLFWSLGNRWIPCTQSWKAISISTKSYATHQNVTTCVTPLSPALVGNTEIVIMYLWQLVVK